MFWWQQVWNPFLITLTFTCCWMIKNSTKIPSNLGEGLIFSKINQSINSGFLLYVRHKTWCFQIYSLTWCSQQPQEKVRIIPVVLSATSWMRFLGTNLLKTATAPTLRPVYPALFSFSTCIAAVIESPEVLRARAPVTVSGTVSGSIKRLRKVLRPWWSGMGTSKTRDFSAPSGTSTQGRRLAHERRPYRKTRRGRMRGEQQQIRVQIPAEGCCWD